MANREKYILLEKQKGLPIFMQSWWLDMVCKNSWDVFLVEEDDNILAAFPYYIHKNKFFTSIIPPELTPVCGCYVDYSFCNRISERYSLENRITEEFALFIDSLKPSFFSYTLRPEDFFCMGFHWHKFSNTVRYTYRVDVSDIDNCFESFVPVMRKNIRRAERLLHTEYDNFNLIQIYSLLKQTYSKQNIEIPYSFLTFKDIVNKSIQQNQGKLLIAKDEKDNVNGVLFIVWDDNICYNLISGIDFRFEKNKVMAYLTWKAMQYAHSLNLKTFDMEGSMLKNIEHYFRFFSGTRTPYLVITKEYSKLYSLLRKIKNSF